MAEAGELEKIPLFAGASPSLRARIASHSAEVLAAPGAWVTREGDAAYLWLVLSGEVERVRLLSGQETLESVAGNGHLERIVTRCSTSGAEQERAAHSLFIFIGADAETDWLPEALERDQHGYIRTGREIEDWRLSRKSYPLETSIPGIFAAGDVRSSSVKRVASSVGEGSMGDFVHPQYLESQSVLRD